MKIVKVKLARNSNPGGGTHLTYPEHYHSDQIDILRYCGSEDFPNKDFAYCIGVLKKDEYLDEFLKSPEIVEIQEAQACADGDKWQPQIEIVKDSNKVVSILAKKARGIQLEQKDLDALDPDKDEAGIGKSKSVSDMLQAYKK